MKLLLAVLLVCVAAGARADEALWALLKQGGQVVLVRHAATDPGVSPGTAELVIVAPEGGGTVGTVGTYRLAGRIAIAE